MLTRWDPFRDLYTMQKAMDRIVESLSDRPGDGEIAEWSLAMDVVENEDGYIVKASVPGIVPEDLEVTYSDNTLTIRGEIRPDEIEQGRYHLRERRFGRFSRSLTLPQRVNADQIGATFNNGVLTLHLPKAEEVKPRRISIESGSSQPMIEGKRSNGK